MKNRKQHRDALTQTLERPGSLGSMIGIGGVGNSGGVDLLSNTVHSQIPIDSPHFHAWTRDLFTPHKEIDLGPAETREGAIAMGEEAVKRACKATREEWPVTDPVLGDYEVVSIQAQVTLTARVRPCSKPECARAAIERALLEDR